MRAPVHCVLFLAPCYGCLQRGRALFSHALSATSHTGGHSRATRARSHPNTLARTHILDAKPRALCRQEPGHRQELAPRRLAVAYKQGLHR